MHQAHHTEMSGWVRSCGECGQIDIHSLFPNPEMVDDPFWRCGTCLTRSLVALHVQFAAPSK